MKISCPLCISEVLIIRDKLSINSLNYLSKESLGIEILNHFKNIEEVKFLECNNCNLKFYSPTVSGDRSFYDELSKFHWYYQDEKDEYDFASNFININDKVLEVGCGIGKFSDKIVCKDYTGLEFSLNAIKKATERGIKVLNENIESHVINNSGKYDVVCNFQVLEHVTNIHQFLDACISCLRVSGLLIVSVPNDESYIGKTKNNILNLPPHHVSRWSENVFRKIPELFDVKLEKIHKERVRDELIGSYNKTTLLSKVHSKPDLIDLSAGFRIKRKLVSVITGTFGNKIDRSKNNPDGHSITAVFRKC